MTTYRRPVLYVNAEDFDAESEARQRAERDPGFVGLGAGADSVLSLVQHAAAGAGGADLPGTRHAVLSQVRVQQGAARKHDARGAGVGRRLGRASRRPGTGRANLTTRHDGPGRAPETAGTGDRRQKAPPASETTAHNGPGATIAPALDVPVAAIAAHVAALHRALEGRNLPEGARVFGFYNGTTGEIAIHVEPAP